MSRHNVQLVVFLILAGYGLALADPASQEAAESPPVPVGSGGALGTFQHEAYVLKTGDKLEIFVNALPDLPPVYEVRVDGGFFHPVVGEMKASGRTVADLRKEFGTQLGKELKRPEFRLGLQQISKHQVAVLGEAKSQGSFEVGVGATVLDVLARAGGLGEKADRRRATILRGNQQIPVTLEPVEGQGLTKMVAGDVLYIQAGSPVSVAGEVTTPGAYTVSGTGASPWEAIIAAGGAKEEAALSRVKLIRPTFPEPLILDLRPETGAPLPEEAAQLLPGDIVVVPPRQAVVLGAVAEPGPVPLTREVTLLDVLSSRVNQNSDIKHIYVVRSEDVFQQRETKEEYNLEEYFKDGNPEVASVPIRDGDLIYVPQKGKGGGVFSFGGILSIINLARLLF